jgi:hypothetical protein
VTEPLPVPSVAVVKVKVVAELGSKVATTGRFEFTVRLQDGLLPEHAPAQSANFDPVLAVAVSVTVVPNGYV